jgi:hypothetical protein
MMHRMENVNFIISPAIDRPLCRRDYNKHYMIKQQLRRLQIVIGGPGSSVGIATDYGLDGPGIESRWGRDFTHTSRPDLGPTQTPAQWVSGLSWE